MGGHSHWSTIKRKKGAEDARRGKIFTRLIKDMTVAARIGGGDADTNPRLRLAIDKAKGATMPADNIKKAIMRGTGELPGVQYEEMTYEAYGPGGVAMLIEISTDNKNRTVAEIRNLLEKKGGRLAETGSVAWMFNKKGHLVVNRDQVDEEKLMNLVLESGAEDLRTEGELFIVITPPMEYEKVKKAVDDEKIPMVTSEVIYLPQSTVSVEGKEAERVLKLVEALEEHDDVQAVHANFDIPDSVMEKVESGGS